MQQKLLPLRKRAEFLAVQKGEKRRGALFLLELKQRPPLEAQAVLPPRIGLTVTRKNGNAVRRNRIKRRLRAALRVGAVAELAAAQTDYVLVARPEILTAPFLQLVAELRRRFSRPAAASPDAAQRGGQARRRDKQR